MSQIDANITNRKIENALKHKEIARIIEAGLPVITINPDEDILGATVGQAHLMLLGISGLTPELSAEVNMRCNAVAVKLCALRYHRTKFEEIQKKRLSEISADSNISSLFQKGFKICEIEMLHEVEAYFHQYKSALDMLVKILCPFTGLNAGTLSSYRDKGQGVIKILEKFKKNKNHGLAVGRIDWLIEEIEKTKSPWMESVIRLRDTFSHYKPHFAFGFEWDKEVGRIRVPFIESDDGLRPLTTVMDKLTEQLITYCTNFIAITVSSAFPVTTEIQVMTENEKRYLSAKWQMDLSKTIWMLGTNVIREITEEDIGKAKEWSKDNLFDY